MISIPRTDRSLLGNWWWTVDRMLLLALAVLAGIGVILVFAASPAVSERVYGGGMRFVVKHVMFLGPGALLLLGVSLLAPRGVLRLALAMLAVFGFLLLMTLFFAQEVKGAHRWLVLGGLQLQPSEFVKPALSVVCAWLLTRKGGLAAFPESAALVGCVLFVLIQQPDIGMSAVIAFVYGAQLFVAGLGWLWIVAMLGLGVGGLFQAYLFWPHFRDRVDDFLDPGSLGYQVDQALRAVASGGLFGRGPGEGVTKFRLPDAHADFIFAATAEEFGILACLVLVALFGFVMLRALWRILDAGDRFVQLAATGLIAQFGLQALINMAVNLNLMPTKGMTLPFISYGGSSLLALAIGMGMLLALTRRGVRLERGP
ncbi:MAG TPA: putative peptidoglycan glycosyltransferase FtsW [Geminicoccaceae bacterium]|nr:putative peptidoglycan glycosyltransferase FtsW [Geminicoccaceae bacterium]